jgi:signal peptidase II
MLYLLISAVIIAGDQFFKRWIIANISLSGSMKLLPGIIGLTHIRNEGISFGILKGMSLPVIIFTIIICGFIIWAFVTKRFKLPGEKLGAALVLGGAIGNLIDRIVYGFVVDMFRTEFINFAIFNIADVAITLGCIVFILSFLVGDIRFRRVLKTFRPQKRDEAAEKSLMEALSAFKPEALAAEANPDETAQASADDTVSEIETETEAETEPEAEPEPDAEPEAEAPQEEPDASSDNS